MLQRWRQWIQRVEDALLTCLLLVLVLICCGQIGLRLLFDSGWVWAEPASRALVLWLAMFGALAATRDGKHIAIDVVPRLLPATWRRVSWIVTQAFAALVCGAMTWYCLRLLALEREAPVLLFGGVQSWVAMLILPAGFGLMMLRFTLSAFAPPPAVVAAKD